MLRLFYKLTGLSEKEICKKVGHDYYKIWGKKYDEYLKKVKKHYKNSGGGFLNVESVRCRHCRKAYIYCYITDAFGDQYGEWYEDIENIKNNIFVG